MTKKKKPGLGTSSGGPRVIHKRATKKKKATRRKATRKKKATKK